MKKMMIIDGSSLLYRAFFALPPLSNAHGIPTNAVYGFLTMLLKAYEQIKPDYVAVAFDKGKVTFRTDMYSEYKAHRPPAPVELSSQFELIKEVLLVLGIPSLEEEGYEGDDIIGSLSKKFGGPELETYIITGDRDALQLVDSYSSVWLTKKGISEILHITEENIEEIYGYSPAAVIEMKALMGDSSDNIPGVPGVGEKTALKLISEFKTIDNLYNNIEDIKGKLKEKLSHNKEMAFLSKDLATINTHMDMPWKPENFVPELRGEDLRRLFDHLGFHSILSRVEHVFGKENLPDIEDFSASLPIEYKDLASLEPAFWKEKDISVYLRTEGKSPFEKIREIYLFNGEMFAKAEDDQVLIGKLESIMREAKSIITMQGKTLMEALGESEPLLIPVYEKERSLSKGSLIPKEADLFAFAENIDDIPDLSMEKNFSIEEERKARFFDIALMAYLLDPTRNNYGISYLCERFNEKVISSADADKEGRDIVRALYAMKEVAIGEIAEKGLLYLYNEIELPLIYSLGVMEKNGIYINLEDLKAIKSEFNREIETLTKGIYSLAGHEFNINSPKQLGVVLFEEMGLPIIRKTKTGYSTDAEVLDLLKPSHSIIEKILSYRTVAKLVSTYLEGLEDLVSEKTKRIHTTFNQTVTATGRLSSSDPNLQNIPVRTERGKQIRSLFLPGPGYDYLVSADYSQIELRVLAHFCGDEGMLKAFAEGLDIHRYTAAEVLSKPVEEVTSEERSHAKAVNFGIIYGISDFGLSRDLGITREEAKRYIETYLGRYGKIKSFMDSMIEMARQEGLVRTMFGRLRTLPDINSRNFNRRSFAERTAMNTPIQGTAADIIKLAMIRVEECIRTLNMRSRLLLQVHDELVFEAPEDEVEKLEELLKEEMEKIVSLSVPLEVDVHHAKNWALIK